MSRKPSAALLAALCLSCTAFIPRAKAQFALKTNLLYDATTTPNIGAELAVSQKNTINLVYGLNPWTFSDGKKAKHWVAMPEFRWWNCTAFNGSFFGVHAMGGQFNAAKVNLPIPGAFFGGDNIRTGVKDSRMQGTFAGVGATYGYQWSITRHFNIEAEIGVGYNHIWYNKYPCTECGNKIKSGQTNYAGITKLGLSLMYIF